MRKILITGCLICLPYVACSQTSDRDYLTAFLEDSLSGTDRKVVVTGFTGALSSQASLTELTVADNQGIWLTLRDVSLDWSRSSLLSGELVVNHLTADEILLDRLPVAASDAPSAEAGSFTLPELPVSIDIGEISARHIVLGPSVLGTGLEATLEASLSLAGGDGKANLLLKRTDAGPAGNVSLTASYANDTQRLAIDLTAAEAAGGIVSTKLNIPGTPAISLTAKGEGPVSDFSADIALASNGVDRLSGQVTLNGTADAATSFNADVAGDLAPLFLPSYAEFFGNSVSLTTSGKRWPDGRLELESLSVNAKALTLQGALALAEDGLPLKFSLQGEIAAPDASPVQLPLTTAQPIKVASAEIALAYDASKGEGWTANITTLGLDSADFRADRLTIAGSGRIARLAGSRQVGGTLRFSGEGLAPTNAALGRALGSVVWGDALGFWREGDGSLSVQRLNLNGEDYSAAMNGKIEGLGDAFAVTGQASAKIDNLNRLSGLVGRNLAGAAQVGLSGTASPITGAFDVEADVTGENMQIGIAEVDSLLKGTSKLQTSVKRDTVGTILRSMTLEAQNLSAEASGTLATAGSDVLATLDFTDLRSLGGQYRGRLTGKARLTGTLAEGKIVLDATGRSLGIGNPQADKLLNGDSTVALILALKDGVIKVDSANLTNPQLEARATGVLDGSKQTITLEAKLRNLALLLPEFPGALIVQGTAEQDRSGIALNLKGKGPGQIDATVTGQIAPGFSSGDLAIKGTAQAALANGFIQPRAISGKLGFDLKLVGALQLASLRGPVTLTDGKLADPGLNFGLQGIQATADLSAGKAAITSTMQVSSGGKLAITGTSSLTAPFDGDLVVDIQRVTLRDPDLYEATLNGGVTVKGPLLGGAMIAGKIAMTQTELRVPSTGFGGAGGLPGLKHKNETKPVRDTRARAGLIATGKSSATGTATGYGLDIVLSAPSRLFIRGRGLDAEMGGELHLLGNTKSVSPGGSFSLIRGRLDILGKRLDLDEALLQMEGELVPYLHITASTENDGITSGVAIDGPATDPTVRFTSSPELPQEEVLAQLLFGQGLQSLSALQALQLANAVATLAGKGGEGVVSKLRKSFGLDNLDIKTDASGGTSLSAGKYLSKKLYSEVTVDQSGQSQINLNLDVTKSITLRAQAGSDGNAGLGVVLEKDY